MSLRALPSLLRETIREFLDDDALQLGAALAYYTALSLAPLLVTLLALAGLFLGGDGVRSDILAQLKQLMGREAADAIATVLENADRPQLGTATAIGGVIMLLIGASSVFAQLQRSLNQIWDVEPRKDAGIKRMLRVRLTAMGVVLAIGFLLISSLVASTAIATVVNYFERLLPTSGGVAMACNLLFSIGFMTLLFGLIYRLLPDVKISWKDVLVGATITAVLFAVGQMLIGLYLGYTSTASAYGAAGSLIVLLIWVYYSAQIFFFGAEFTQVWARRYGAEIVPADHAQWSGEGNCEDPKAANQANSDDSVQAA